MSDADSVPSNGGLCEFCGLPITEGYQDCAALDDGRCQTTKEVLEALGGDPA